MTYTNYTLATSNLLRRVYSWMTAGLAVTGLVAYATFESGLINTLYKNPALLWVLLFAQLGCVAFLSLRITKMDFSTAVITFLAYAAMTGLTLSGVFAVYTMSSIAVTFLVSSAMFGAMAAYGYSTNADLSSLGSFLFMALLGLILASVVNIFVGSTQFELLLSAVAVIIFTLLTAYDVQMLKRLSYDLQGQAAANIAIIGALQLYLNWLNLFLSLLQFLGDKKRRD